MRVTIIRKPLQVAIVALSICPALVLGASADVPVGQVPDSTATSNSPNPIKDVPYVVETFTRDAFHIYTFPLHMSARDASVLAGAVAVTGLLYAFDEEILDMAHRNEDSDLLRPLWQTGDFFEPVGHMGNTNIWYLGGAALGYVTRQDKLTLICAQILESHYIAGMGKNAIQYFVRRPRPFQDFGPREFGVENATSFPSGHSSNIFQLAPILSHHVNRRAFTVLAYTVSTSVALQRIRSDMHWTSDVFLSAFYGWSVAKGVLRLHEGRRLVVEPHVSALGVGLQLTTRF